MLPNRTLLKKTVYRQKPSPTRIGIDGRNLGLNQGTGVASYARVLMESYQKIDLTPEVLLPDEPRHNNDFLRQRCQSLLRVPRGSLPCRPVRRLPDDSGGSMLFSSDVFRVAQVHFDLYGAPLALKCKNPPHVMHWTYPLPVYMHGVPNLLTIHDLIPVVSPEFTSIESGRMERLIQRVIAKADYILTVSETVRAQVIKVLGVAAERVVNCYQAVEISSALLSAAASAPMLCPPGSFVCFGTEMYRKNIGRLIEAHAASGVASPLVIIGSGAAEPPQGENIINVPWASRAALVRAMQQARAVLFPSLAEGFGLPMVEAMALGTPVMTSGLGATQEIAGDGALLVNPLDIREMATAIGALESQPELRESLRATGLRRAAFFSEQAYLQRLRNFYEMAGFF